MKKIFFILVALFGNFSHSKVFAEESILWLSDEELRAGDIDIKDIPLMIATVTNTIIGIAGTVSIIMLIYFAVQMQINSGITGDSSGVDKARKGMIAAGIGFVISICAWFFVTRVVELLYSVG